MAESAPSRAPKTAPGLATSATGRELAVTAGIAAILFALIAGFTLLVFGGGAPRPTPGQINTQPVVNALTAPTATPAGPPPTATPVQSPAQYKASAKDVSVADIASNPNAYLGVDVTFRGQVIGLLHNSTGAVAGVNLADPASPSAIIQVNFSPYVIPANVHVNDALTVWGQGTGSFISINGLGKSQAEGAVNELYLHDATSGYNDNTIQDPAAYISGSG